MVNEEAIREAFSRVRVEIDAQGGEINLITRSMEGLAVRIAESNKEIIDLKYEVQKLRNNLRKTRSELRKEFQASKKKKQIK